MRSKPVARRLAQGKYATPSVLSFTFYLFFYFWLLLWLWILFLRLCSCPVTKVSDVDWNWSAITATYYRQNPTMYLEVRATLLLDLEPVAMLIGVWRWYKVSGYFCLFLASSAKFSRASVWANNWQKPFGVQKYRIKASIERLSRN